MGTPLKTRKKMAVILLTGLFFLLQGATVSSALAASQTATSQPVPGKTTTVPAGKVLPSNTTVTAPLPLTVPARNYQQVEKAPVYKLEIPEYDLAGKISGVLFEKRNNQSGSKDKIEFTISLKNHGTRRIPAGTPIDIRIRLINTATDTLIHDGRTRFSNKDFALKSEYWVEMPEKGVWFKMGESPAPQTLNDLKLVVDIDPTHKFHEAQRYLGNNRCVATW